MEAFNLKVTAVFVEDTVRGGYTAYAEGIPAISEGNTFEEAKNNLISVLKTVFKIKKMPYSDVKGKNIIRQDLTVSV